MMYVPYPPSQHQMFEGEEGPTIRDCVVILSLLVLWHGLAVDE